MRYKPFGRTGFQVSEIGFGCWGIGGTAWIGADDSASLQALTAARDLGINFFDTALAYGHGHSEQLLARAFGKSDKVFIASKVPPRDRTWITGPGVELKHVFPRKYVLASLRTTLSNLRREAVDLYQFHAWADHWADDPEWQRTVEEMRRSGNARFIGISVNTGRPGSVLRALATGLVDSVQVDYNIFDQSAQSELLPYCQEHKIGFIGRVPFGEGALTGAIRPDTTFPRGDFRNEYFNSERKRQVWDRLQRLIQETGSPLEQLPQLALRFCISHPAVSTVIPGMRTQSHVESNVAAAEAGVLPETTRQILRGHHWETGAARERPTEEQPVSQPLRARLVSWAKTHLIIICERYVPSSLLSWVLKLQQ